MADTPKQDATAEPAPNGSSELGTAAEPAQTSRAESTPGTTSTGDAAAQDGGAKDVAMIDAPGDQAAASPALAQPAATSTSTPTPVPPPRTSTPMRGTTATGTSGTNGDGSSSRAASAHPDAGAAVAATMPTEAAHHGAPVRTYLNSKVTGVLLEGMKQIAKDQPKDPLRVLGEFLLERSKELEGAN